MQKIRSIDRAALYGWIVMLAIPFIVMGWTIGQYGPGSDGWTLFNRLYHGQFFPTDVTRPLTYAPRVLMWLIAGGHIPTIEVLYCLLESLSAALFFEVMRRVFSKWLGRVGVFAALLVALIYVLYPSYADRLYLGTINDSVNRVLTAAITLLWVIAAEKDQIRYAIAATVLTVLTLLHKENSTLVFGLLPFIGLLYGRSPLEGRWRTATIVCWLALGGYVIWRILPSRLGGITGPSRSVQFTDPVGLIPFFAGSIGNMVGDAFHLAFVDSLADFQQMGLGWVLPAAIAGAALVIAGGWLVSRGDFQAEPGRVSLRAWGLMALFGAAEVLLGLVLFYLELGHATPVGGMESRNTTVAMIGISLLFGLAILAPMILTRQYASPWPGRERLWRGAGLAISGALAGVLLVGGVLRQARMDIAFVDAWQEQRTYWQRIGDLDLTIRPDMLIVMEDFPRLNHGAPLASSNWGYASAFELLFGAPGDILTINSGEIEQPSIKGDTLTMNVYGDDVSYPLEDIRVIRYEPKTRTVRLMPYLPAAWTGKLVPVFTGDNPPQPPLALNPYGASVLGQPVGQVGCRTSVHIHSADVAPADGSVEIAVAPGNEVFDRRPAARGAKLDFNFYAPCGVWIRAYFASAESTVFLVSQYGPGEEYGTAESGDNPSYETAFGKAAPADPLH